MIGAGNFTLALVAGIFATFNPCGFAMLPAYLSFIILGEKNAKSRRQYFADALSFSLFMGLGVLAVFALFAAAIIPFASSIQKYLPIFTLVIGALLIAAGISIITGKNFLSTKLWSPSISPTGKILSFIGYGVTFALGSVSCTIGPFLAITNSVLATSNPLRILMTYLSFGLGISLTIGILAFLTATSQLFLQRNLRKLSRLISLGSSILLIFVGLYLLYFGWYELRLSGGSSSSDVVMRAAFNFQGWIVSTVQRFLQIIHLIG